MNPARPPHDATPAAVLAADPPDTSIAGPMCSYSSNARASSINVIAPFVNPCDAMKSSGACASTSTMALPMASTSSEGKGMPQKLTACSKTSSMVEEGSAAPPFALPDQDNNTVSLEDQRGKWVVLW